jgi:LysM repeat protein
MKPNNVILCFSCILIAAITLTKPTEASSWNRPFQPEQADFQKFLNEVQGMGPPQTIRVRITGKAACDINAPYTVVTMDFKTYVKNVLPNEWPHWWHGESLKAGAVAVKMYAWYWIARGGKWSDADVVDSTCDQRYLQGSSHSSTNRAVEDTWNFALTRDGSIFETQHRNSQACQPPHCMRQSGSQELAREGYRWEEILAYYYTGSSTGSSMGAFGIIVPVEVATPDPFGIIIHIVEPGQSLWAVADAYEITIGELEVWNNLSREDKLKIGERLFIPGEHTEGYATPTPNNMILVSTPDADGIITHYVQPNQTLSTISQAYGISIERLLTLNNIRRDRLLQNGQMLLIDPGHVTPSPTARPLTPVEKLTPASDGKYYHTVESGQNLSRIADLYDISLFDLVDWNDLNMDANLQPDQKLVLHVTPPATDTPTPSPTSTTGPPLPVPDGATYTPTSTEAYVPAPPQADVEAARNIPSEQALESDRLEVEHGLVIVLGASSILLIAWIIRKKIPIKPKD